MDPIFGIIATIIGFGASGWNDTPQTGSVTVAAPASASQQEFVAEPQTPTGKFTTATEVKMILNATKPQWVAVRDYNGQDLMYLTNLLSWRCGLLQVQYALNGGPLQDWPLPPCHEGTATPNALTPDDGLPYAAFDPGSIQSVRIEILYDDLSRDSATYQRSDVLMP